MTKKKETVSVDAVFDRLLPFNPIMATSKTGKISKPLKKKQIASAPAKTNKTPASGKKVAGMTPLAGKSIEIMQKNSPEAALRPEPGKSQRSGARPAQKTAAHSKGIIQKGTKKSDMARAYDPAHVETRLYKNWIENDTFVPRPSKSGKRFVVPIPPPNVTGNLHLGHAMFLTLQDLMTRFHRMLGEETLYLPGTDHAGISTQMVVEKHLAKEGKTREQLGREKFLDSAWQWKEKYRDIILDQIRRMGTSCDWSRERFTMDPGMNRAVRKVFVDLYNEGLIYRDKYLVNWCPRCKTVLSDLEVNYKEETTKMVSIRYFVKAADKSIIVSTVRPETMLGDTAVALHPDDKRYKEFHGKTLILPILNREIPIILDEAVDMNFGSGAVKVTPAHDLTDYEMYKRHHLEIISVIGKDGKMARSAGKYAGLSVEQARENITEYLRNIGNLEDIQEYVHNVARCERCDTKLEPYLSEQWFVRMRPLAEETLDQMKKEKLTFVPDRFEKVFMDWLHNVHDWCISRQLWWGHQIPAYYCDQCADIVVSEDPVQTCPKCKKGSLRQDEDVLDTWFSSALWPFSTLGWPLKTEDLQKFYPASVLETGYDIIFFWVMRMVFMSTHFMKKLPFHTVYLHGLVRDEQGRKMSKSKGIGLDPLEVIKKYGADALRLSLSVGITPGNDVRLSLGKVEGNRNFVNKLWNASRFIVLNLEKTDTVLEVETRLTKRFKNLSSPSRWILTRTQQMIQKVTDDLSQYRFGEAGTSLYEYTWGEFCDWYIEIAKTDLNDDTKDILLYCMLTMLKLWHPFIPFITEELWSSFDQPSQLIIADWPMSNKALIDAKNLEDIRLAFDLVTGIRNLRAEKNIEPHRRVPIVIFAHANTDLVKSYASIIQALAKVETLTIQKEGTLKEQSVSQNVEGMEVYMPLAGLIDLEAERKKLQAEIEQKTKFIASLERKLKNEDFLSKAPKAIIESDRARLAKEKEVLRTLKVQLEKIS